MPRRKIGVEIPTLCHDDRLQDVGACRLCLVEIDGQSKPAMSCTTPLADGMKIATDSAKIVDARRWNLRHAREELSPGSIRAVS